MIDLYRPTILVATPSYSLASRGRMREAGADPAASSIVTVICGGEPASGSHRRAGESRKPGTPKCTMFTDAPKRFPQDGRSLVAKDSSAIRRHAREEDLQIWELVDPDTFEPVAPGARGLTVVTNLNSEGSPQLRFFGRRLCDLSITANACAAAPSRALAADSTDAPTTCSTFAG